METIFDEVLRLRCYLRDLVALSALPVVWTGHNLLEMVDYLVDMLLSSLRVDLVYARLRHAADAPIVETARAAQQAHLQTQAHEISRVLATWLQSGGPPPPPWIPNPVGDGVVRLVITPIGHGGEDGILATGRFSDG